MKVGAALVHETPVIAVGDPVTFVDGGGDIAHGVVHESSDWNIGASVIIKFSAPLTQTPFVCVRHAQGIDWLPGHLDSATEQAKALQAAVALTEGDHP